MSFTTTRKIPPVLVVRLQPGQGLRQSCAGRLEGRAVRAPSNGRSAAVERGPAVVRRRPVTASQGGLKRAPGRGGQGVTE